MREYRDGEWLAICDRCGFEYYASQLSMEWTGLRVCHKCWEPRHLQDFVRGIPDKQTPPWTRPQPADAFVDPNQVDPDPSVNGDFNADFNTDFV